MNQGTFNGTWRNLMRLFTKATHLHTHAQSTLKRPKSSFYHCHCEHVSQLMLAFSPKQSTCRTATMAVDCSLKDRDGKLYFVTVLE